MRVETRLKQLLPQCDSKLVGDENEDQKTVCHWFATSYGEVNKEYHEAYSRQIISQIRTECESDEENEPSDHAKWF